MADLHVNFNIQKLIILNNGSANDRYTDGQSEKKFNYIDACVQ